MTEAVLESTSLSAGSRLEELRLRVIGSQFQDGQQIREFVDRYVSEYPEAARSRSGGAVDALVGDIRTDLGIPFQSPGSAEVIPEHVRDLVLGDASVSRDTSHWAVHHGAGEVTMFSGQYVYDATHAFLAGAGMDFVFRCVYKNQGFHNGPLGVNWDHAYNLRLRVLDGGNTIVRTTGTFQEQRYVRHGLYGGAGYNYWVPAPGDHDVVIDLAHRQEFGIDRPQTVAHCQYASRKPDGTVYYYEPAGQGIPDRYRIRRIQDCRGNYLDFGYTPLGGDATEVLTSVEVNSPARVLDFAYDSEARLTLIEDYTGRQWQYEYDDFGDLVAFTAPATKRYPGGLQQRFEYSTAGMSGELAHNMLQLFDTADRLYIENEFGVDSGSLSFNRVVRQREGAGERQFLYEDVSLKTGLPEAAAVEDEHHPAHQTVMVRRNGHPEHYVYNRFGNLLAREEDVWSAGTRRRLVTHYRYNRDGALIGEASPEGRVTQHLYERDVFARSPAVAGLSEDDLLQQPSLTWRARQAFGSRLAIVRRAGQSKPHAAFQFPTPIPSLDLIHPDDIITKFDYQGDHQAEVEFRGDYQAVTSVSDPRHTRSPWPDAADDSAANNPEYHACLTRFAYRDGGRLLDQIRYPNCTREGKDELVGIVERFPGYDQRGRPTEYVDPRGTHIKLEYHPPTLDPLAPDAAKEGYLRHQVTDPTDPLTNPAGLDLKIQMKVNDVGVTEGVVTPKGHEIKFIVDELNRVVTGTRTLKPGVEYSVVYEYCRNMLLEAKRRDLRDDQGTSLWGGTEVEFYKYDENDNLVQRRIGGQDRLKDFITRHTYDDGDLRTGTILPRGNRERIEYDERRLPRRIVRGAGSAEAVEIRLSYDGDGLIADHRDGCGQRTAFTHDAFGRPTETRNFDEAGKLVRIVRQDYDKDDNLIIERVFAPTGDGFDLLSHTQNLFDEMRRRIETRVRRFQDPIHYSREEVDRADDTVDDEDAVRTLYYYDQAGAIVGLEEHGRRLLPEGSLAAAPTILRTEIAYNAVGWPVLERDPLGHKTDTHYDAHGLVTRIDVRENVPQSATGERVFSTFYEYDNLDRLTTITDSLGNKTHFGYDSRDKVIRITDSLGNVVHHEFDVYGRHVVERRETTVSGLGDGLRLPNSDIVIKKVLDGNGNLVELVDANGVSTTRAYDALDRPIELRYADGTRVSLSYDGNDNVTLEQDNNGLIRRNVYDALDNLVRTDVDTSELAPNVVVGGATFAAFEQDALGRRTRATNDWCDIRFRHDSLGRVYEETTRFLPEPRQFVLERRHDDFDFVGRLTYPSGRVIAYEPDALNRVARVRNVVHGAGYPGDSTQPTNRILLDNEYAGLRIERKSYSDAADTAFAYDGAGRTIRIAHADPQGQDLLALEQLYDGAGNMRLAAESGGGLTSATRYLYDSLAQLTHWKPLAPPPPIDTVALAPATIAPASAAVLTGQHQIDLLVGPRAQVPGEATYVYDPVGNRLVEHRPGQQPILYAVNELNQYDSRGGTTYDYDLNGNLVEATTSLGSRRYEYDYLDRVVSIADGGSSVEYRYDALGRRFYARDGLVTTISVFDDDSEIEEWERGVPGRPGTLTAQYVNEPQMDGPFHLATAGSDFVLLKDLVGSVRMIVPTPPAGAPAAAPLRFQYSPFGMLGVGWGGSPTQYGFMGRPRLVSGVDVDARDRIYSTDLGRFLQRDPANRISPNLYRYADNAPLTRVDPWGDESDSKVPAGYYRHETGLILRNGQSPEDYYRRHILDKTSWQHAREQFLEKEVPRLYESLEPWLPISKTIMSLVVFATPVTVWGLGASVAIGGSEVAVADIAYLAYEKVQHEADKEINYVRGVVRQKQRLSRLDKELRGNRLLYMQEFEKALASKEVQSYPEHWRRARAGKIAETKAIPDAIKRLKGHGFTDFKYKKATGTGFPGIKGGPTNLDLIASSPHMEVGVDYQTSHDYDKRKVIQRQNHMRWVEAQHMKTGKKVALFHISLSNIHYWSGTMCSRWAASERQARRAKGWKVRVPWR